MTAPVGLVAVDAVGATWVLTPDGAWTAATVPVAPNLGPAFPVTFYVPAQQLAEPLPVVVPVDDVVAPADPPSVVEP